MPKARTTRLPEPRYTDKEAQRIRRAAKRQGKSVSAYLRDTVLIATP